MKRPVLRRLMYLGFQGLQALVRLLPVAVSGGLGRALGLAAYLLLRTQRRLAMEHLGQAFGGTRTLADRRRIARRMFRNLGLNAVEWLRLPRLTARDLQRLITGEGIEHLRRAMAEGDGAIVVTAHFGNWELIPLYLRSLGFEGAVLARRLRYPEYESFLISLRGAKGIPTLARGSIKEVARLLRANQIVGILPDQDVDSLEGIFVDFFGRPAYTPIGPAALSLMTGAPILPCFIIREGGRFRLVIEPPLQAAPGTDRAQAVAALTTAWSGVVESYIRRHPDHWVWMHRRWKTRPSNQPSAVSTQREGGEDHRDTTPRVAGEPTASPRPQLASFFLLLASYLLLPALLAIAGCAKPGTQQAQKPTSEQAPAAPSNVAQEMSEFTLTGYSDQGSARWKLDGQGAILDGDIVTILRPDGVGYEPSRTAYLTASVALMNQTSRHVRMEHDVTIHTSDGMWFASPVLHWIPDRDQIATDQPVRVETDHMLLRGREMTGFTQLKQVKILRDIELVLNPADHDAGAAAPAQVTITCDGPLSFDYEHHVATFEQNVHVKDPSGDLYSDQLVAYLEEATHTIRYAEATGRVRIVQNQNTALSERAVYEPAIGKITLLGKPSLLVYPSSSGERQAPQFSFGGLAAAPAPARETAKTSTTP